MGYKCCSRCKTNKPLSEFEQSKFYADGYRGQCRPCRVSNNNAYRKKTGYKNIDPVKRRARRLEKEFGLTESDYVVLHQSQGGKCAICGTPEESAVFKRLGVDHCHRTGRVRGLLCSHCNSGIAMFRDNKEFLSKAIDYLHN